MTSNIDNIKNSRVGIIGLGYVGMPLALMLSRHVKVTGFDVSETRITDLKNGYDSNREIRQADLRTTSCYFTSDMCDIKDCNIYIVTVPTPINDKNEPDLTAIKSASKMISSYLKKGDIVVYESTVYPGVTEDICGRILAKDCGMACGKDFFLGYSPERINPGDTEHTVQNITKIVSGQTAEVTDFLADLYGCVNNGNIFKAKNIRTAEASKAIENAQRDINVAFINEVTIIMNKLGLSARDVLDAAQTKWNFLPFSPGLVGGHCIGVDPYYLAHCAKSIGHIPEVILAGRKTNDSMGVFVADHIMNILHNKKNKKIERSSRILLLGFTFKENINDIRNTKVIDIINHLKESGHHVDIHDPHAIQSEVQKEYGVSLMHSLSAEDKYDCVALIVNHRIYKDMSANSIDELINKDGIVYDLKGAWIDLNFKNSITYCSL